MDPGSGGGGGGGGGGGSSSSSDSAPDCWDQADMEAPGPGPCGGAGGLLAAAAAEAQREHLSAAFSRQLNVNAKPFVPNVHAAEFVPSFLRGPAQSPASPAGAAANNHGAGSGAGGPLGKGPGSAPGTGGSRAARAGADGLGAGAYWDGARGRIGGAPRPARDAWPWGRETRGALTAAPAVLGGATQGRGGGLRGATAAGWGGGNRVRGAPVRPGVRLSPPPAGAQFPAGKWEPYGTESESVPRGLEARTDGARSRPDGR